MYQNLALFNDILISLLSILISYITLHKHSYLHFLHCTWLGCIRSCTKDPSHEFLINKWLIHSQFMDLGIPLKVVMHHLLIGRIVGLGYQDGFSIVSALVCIVTHWTGPMVSHNLKLSSSHELTKLFHYVVS